jgi:hypothetical protein
MPPLWLVALIAAAAAPFCAAGLQAVLESKLRLRTTRALSQAHSALAHEEQEREERSSDATDARPQPDT